MDLIYTNREGQEIGYLDKYALDMDIGKDNDFELTVPEDIQLMEGSKFYALETEYGGILKKIKAGSAQKDVVWGGSTWRGMLHKKIISPDTGTDYKVATGNVADSINALISTCSLSTLFVCEPHALTVSNYKFTRYCTLGDGITAMLKSKKYRPELSYMGDGKVNIKIVPIVDYSGELEFSSDYNVQVTVEKDSNAVNHLVCLGKGELKDRVVLDLYVDKSGNISKKQSQFGEDEVAEVYDYGSAENIASLETEGTKKLKQIVREKATLTIKEVEVSIGDIVGAREYHTGTYIKREVTQKIVRVQKNQTSIEYKVGE